MRKELIILILSLLYLNSCSVNNTPSNKNKGEVFDNNDIMVEEKSYINGAKSDKLKVKQLDLYCHNYFEQNNYEIKITNTVTSVDESYLIDDKNKVDSKKEVEDNDLELIKILINEGEFITQIEHGVDCRLGLTIKYQSGLSDTLIYMSDYKICWNRKFIYKYEVNTLDVIKNLFEIERIDCM